MQKPRGSLDCLGEEEMGQSQDSHFKMQLPSEKHQDVINPLHLLLSPASMGAQEQRWSSKSLGANSDGTDLGDRCSQTHGRWTTRRPSEEMKRGAGSQSAGRDAALAPPPALGVLPSCSAPTSGASAPQPHGASPA